jgi:hypothetical protein
MLKAEENSSEEPSYDWSEFYIDPASPSGLRWHERRNVKGSGKWVKRQEGDVAGTVNYAGYWVVFTRGRSFRVQRIIVEMHTGVRLRDSDVVDHLDGDRSNNRVENLRVTTYGVNSRNRVLPDANNSGFVGVTFRRRFYATKTHDVWCAYYHNLSGKQVRKTFSIEKYGREAALKMAVEWRAAAIALLQNQGAQYSERHGKEKKPSAEKL